MSKKVCALITENYFHYLDHLAPICLYLDIPLFVTEPDIEEAALAYYPNLKINYIELRDAIFYISKNYNSIISCLTSGFFETSFGFAEETLNKNLELIWIPHGNSDKGKQIHLHKALEDEKTALIYGQHMMDAIGKPIDGIRYIRIGNFRYESYKKNIKFYRKIINDQIISKMPKNKKFALFAPTWKCDAGYSSLDLHGELIDSLRSDWNLIIKIHPNIQTQQLIELEKMMYKYQNKKNIYFLTTFPLIYPILDLVDIYIGDMSSIGYDFLTFNKPMFFFNPMNYEKNHPDLLLFQCGHEIKPKDYQNIFGFIEKKLLIDKKLKNKKQKMYDYTFEKNIDNEELKKKIFLLWKTN